jgi:hypothetical protein
LKKVETGISSTCERGIGAGRNPFLGRLIFVNVLVREANGLSKAGQGQILHQTLKANILANDPLNEFAIATML